MINFGDESAKTLFVTGVWKSNFDNTVWEIAINEDDRVVPVTSTLLPFRIIPNFTCRINFIDIKVQNQ